MSATQLQLLTMCGFSPKHGFACQRWLAAATLQRPAWCTRHAPRPLPDFPRPQTHTRMQTQLPLQVTIANDFSVFYYG